MLLERTISGQSSKHEKSDKKFRFVYVAAGEKLHSDFPVAGLPAIVLIATFLSPACLRIVLGRFGVANFLLTKDILPLPIARTNHLSAA